MTADLGWTVTDPQGTVLDSGPGITLTIVASTGGDDTSEGA